MVMLLKIVPAAEYTIDDLTVFYNRTRVDYLVPMPMSSEVMGEYIHDFDVDLNLSPVILDPETGEFLGFGLLGVRGDRTWITGLGVTPEARRRGAGGAAMDTMLENSRKIGAKKIVLEVIKNNTPARTLFKKTGFQQTKEFLILRRAPLRPPFSPEGEITWLYRKDALAALRSYPYPLTWINSLESMGNASMFQGVDLTLKSGAKAWMVYRHKKHSITHLVIHTERGNHAKMARSLLLYLHLQYLRMDAYTENIFAGDPHLPAFFDLGYFEAFRRIEMVNENI